MEGTYVIGGLKGMKDYIEVLKLVGDQLGSDFNHAYDSKTGTVRFASPVEIDLYPIQKAGFDPKILKPLKGPTSHKTLK